MSAIDYAKALELLNKFYVGAESALLQRTVPLIDPSIKGDIDRIFTSKTQAYREVLLGCILARILDKSVNVRQPYVDLGPSAYSGRTLDERVVNPFLHNKQIPSSRGPYLSVFRRSVTFDATTRQGLRDKEGYDAFLAALNRLENASSDDNLMRFLEYLLYKFVELREQARVPLARLQRISLNQYEELITGLLATPSGGLFPLLLAVSMFEAIKEFFNLDWSIAWQRINVADAASGRGGDITISSDDRILLAIEVTERQVDRARVVATFNTKISPANIEDYLFLVGATEPTPDAKRQAQQYFAQGHEINFAFIKDWIVMLLATMGKNGRTIFNQRLIGSLEDPNVPQILKVAWNQQISGLLEG